MRLKISDVPALSLGNNYYSDFVIFVKLLDQVNFSFAQAIVHDSDAEFKAAFEGLLAQGIYDMFIYF